MFFIENMLEEKNKLHFTLLDPEKQAPSEAAEIAGLCENMGSDAIMLGGSTADNKQVLDDTARLIRGAVTIPLILFPHKADAVTQYTEYIFYMSLLNSENRDYLVGEQVKAARLIKRYDIKPIGMGYIVISTGRKKTTVEKVADLIKLTSKDVEQIIDYALCAQFFGLKCVYLEAGSGAKKPVDPDLISKVKKSIDIPLIVGGGIRDGLTAKTIAEAGADVIVTGTAAEENPQVIKEIIGGLHISHLIPSTGP